MRVERKKSPLETKRKRASKWNQSCRVVGGGGGFGLKIPITKGSFE
uniref:Uncharacterized protein n=1 Tax=Anguilla anguilla TaxID=7936 RepID=A0A0E9R2S7_ANGAN